MYYARKEFIYREIGDQPVLIAVGSAIESFNGVVKLNDTAATMWKTMKDGATLDQIVQALVLEYEIDEKHAKEDVERVLSNLMKQGLVYEL